ncbi:MAG: RNA polymerase sigma factor [Candidatus Eisenbacteria bacterium]
MQPAGFSPVMTDEEAIRQVQRGNDDAFSTLVDRYHGSCRRFALRMLDDPTDADEVVQDTFLRAFRALGRYDHRDRFAAWLMRILINRCRTAARRARKHNAPLVPLEAASRVEDQATTPGRSTEGAEIEAAITELRPEQRELFLLRFVERLSYEEIATVTGVGVSALKMRVLRTRDELRRKLRGEVRE